MPTALAAWLHDLDPIAIPLPDVGFLPDGIRWYGLSYLVGFFLGYLIVRRVAKVGVSTLKPELVSDFIVTVAIGIVVGGRLGYCIFYRPELLVTFYGYFPFWGVLAMNEGGMASHGGMAGGIAACWFYARRHGHSMLFLLDLFAFGAPLGLFFGRIANFINGELFGRIAADWVPWAVKFPQEIWDWDLDRLRRLSPVAAELGVTPLEWTRAIERYGTSYDAQRLVQGTLAEIVEVTRGSGETATAVKAALDPLLMPRHPSQLYAAVMEGLIVFVVLLWVYRVPRKPGLVGSWFCVSYAVMRIINEFFRRPDAHLLDAEFAVIGITRGQWLSLLLLALGVWGIWFSQRRASEPLGGWRGVPAAKASAS